MPESARACRRRTPICLRRELLRTTIAVDGIGFDARNDEPATRLASAAREHAATEHRRRDAARRNPGEVSVKRPISISTPFTWTTYRSLLPVCSTDLNGWPRLRAWRPRGTHTAQGLTRIFHR